MVAGAAGSFLLTDLTAGSALYFLAVGLGMALSGGATLTGYLRATQPTEEE